MWSDLSMQQRADLMDIYLSHGITSLDEMRKHYDSSRKHVYDGTTEDSQQMNRPNIYRYNDGRYVYQAAPDAEEIEVSPINTLLPNPSQWTYQDAEGKVYTPHAAQVDTGSITQSEDTNPLLRAANNYMREAAYRAKDGTLALQGKYTMPVIAASALLPLAGEAAYPLLTNPYVDAAATSAFAGHGLNHAINEGTDGWGDAAMTALELAPLGRLVKPMYNAGNKAINTWFNGLESDIVNITDMNAKSTPLEEWDRQFIAAHNAGDKAKGQRLWDLWYKMKTPGNKAINSNGKAVESFHTVGDNYDPSFNSFDTNIEGLNSSIYTTDNPFMSGSYSRELVSEAERDYIIESTREHLVKQYEKNSSSIGKKLYDFYKNHPKEAKQQIRQDHEFLKGAVNPLRQKSLYTYLQNPVMFDNSGRGWSNLKLNELPEDVYNFIKPDTRSGLLNANYSTRSLEEAQKAAGKYDGSIVHNVVDYGGGKRYGTMDTPGTVYMVNDPRKIKSSEPFTFDDNGNLIPITKRANFNINDIRYGLLPFLGLGAAGALYGKQE